MRTHHLLRAALLSGFVLMLCLAVARPALAQDPAALQTLRGQYDSLMADLERVASARGDTVTAAKARQGREAMEMLSDGQLAEVYSRTRVPDLSVATRASHFLARRAEALAAAGSPAVPMSPGFPNPVAIPAGCNGVDVSGETRYALLIAKEVTNSILAAATFVCNTSILGVNTSLACVPFAIAADIANGLFNTATFCAGEVTANQIDANFNRLDHLHTDLSNAITTIVNTSNANRTSIVNNDNANTAAILANAAANKNELRDLILRSQIEADLATVDGAAVVALFELPNAHGGYLDLVMAIVTETIADVLGAGGSVSIAQSALAEANAARAAGNFKTAYSLYRKAYKAAGR